MIGQILTKEQEANIERFKLAINENDFDKVKQLLEYDYVKANAAADQNEALRTAAENGHLATVKLLLEIEAVRDYDVEIINWDAILTVIDNGHLDVAHLLLSKSAMKNLARDYNLLSSCAVRGCTALVELLLTMPVVRKNEAVRDALIKAIANGHGRIAALLLDLDTVKAHANAEENLALRLAAEHGLTDIVRRLLEIEAVRAYAWAENNYALNAAAFHHHVDIVSMLAALKCVQQSIMRVKTPNPEAFAAKPMIHHCIYADNQTLALCLINGYGPQDDAIYNGRTPLHAAIFEYNGTCVATELIAKEANTEILYDGMTALHHAISMNRTEIALELIKRANLETLYRGMTPLHHAIRNGATDIALALLDKNVNLNTRYRGMTALEHTERSPQIKAAILAKLAEPAAAAPILLQGPKRSRISPKEVGSLLQEARRFVKRPIESVDDDNHAQVRTRKRRSN